MTNDAQSQDVFSKEDWNLAFEKFQIIRPFLEEGVQQVEIAKHHNITTRTIRRWAKKFNEEGISGLIRKKRCYTDLFVSKNLRSFIEGLALKTPRLSVASIYRYLQVMAPQLNETQLPSYATVRRIIQSIDPSLLELAHNGSKAYMEKFDLVHRTEAEAPNAIWQADHTELDIIIKDGNQLKKPWLTIILDDYSRAVAGYALFFGAPSAIQTALAYRQAIWHKSHAGWEICGIPDILYTDHGSDFTSQHMEKLATGIKTTLVFSSVGQPRGRGKIERFFRSLSQILLPTLPAYQPPGSKTKDTNYLTLSQLASRLEDYIVHDYHAKPHGTTKIPPQARWSQNGFLPRLPESLSELDLLLLTVPDARIVQRDGIRFSGFVYIHTTLAGYIGEKVVIRYDPRDVAEISVFHNENFICRAICTDLAGETVSLGEIRTARKRQMQVQKAMIKDRTKTVDELFALRTMTEIEEVTESDAEQPTAKKQSKLKRYHNE